MSTEKGGHECRVTIVCLCEFVFAFVCVFV